jgi:hypothetical protein
MTVSMDLTMIQAGATHKDLLGQYYQLSSRKCFVFVDNEHFSAWMPCEAPEPEEVVPLNSELETKS